MTKINDGGAAFPQPDLSGYGMGPRVGADGCYQMAGMTLRDWFAGQVIIGATTHVDGWDSLADMATSAYQLADAMLAAREADPS